MAKKQKNESRKVSSGAELGVKAVVASRRGESTAEFNPDYGYVRKDLKRIGILAVSFISILAILAIFLR